jgi:uroporphyrin-III C-methyltransferase
MGIKNADSISLQLLKNGMDHNMPVAIIQNATLPFQSLTTSTLDTYPQVIIDKNIKAPAILIIGKIVNLRNKLTDFLQSSTYINHISQDEFGQSYQYLDQPES